MRKSWFKKIHLDQRSVEHVSAFKNIKKYLHHPYLWHLDRESVARGVAIGLFAGIVPIIPFQTILAIFLSIIFRGNLAIAFLTSWISNPLTIVPITYFIYFVGDSILGNTINITTPDFTWDFAHLNWSLFTKWMYQFGKAFFVGLPIVSIGAALTGYFIVTVIWHSAAFFKSHIKKNKR